MKQLVPVSQLIYRNNDEVVDRKLLWFMYGRRFAQMIRVRLLQAVNNRER